MTQEDYNAVKEWVVKVTGIDFEGDEPFFEEDGCSFDKFIDKERAIVLWITNDRSAELWMHFVHDSPIKIYSTSPENIHLCMDIFSHIVNHN